MSTEVLSQALLAGVTATFGGGSMFLLESAATPVTIIARQLGSGSRIRRFTSVPGGFKFTADNPTDGFNSLEIVSPVNQVIAIAIGDDDVAFSNNVTVSGTVVTSQLPYGAVSDLAPVVTVAGQAALFAANGARRSIKVSVDPLAVGASIVYLRKAGGANDLLAMKLMRALKVLVLAMLMTVARLAGAQDAGFPYFPIFGYERLNPSGSGGWAPGKFASRAWECELASSFNGNYYDDVAYFSGHNIGCPSGKNVNDIQDFLGLETNYEHPGVPLNGTGVSLGVATSVSTATPNTLTQTGAGWTVNNLTDQTLFDCGTSACSLDHSVNPGRGSCLIASNTATTVTCKTGQVIAGLASGDNYEILRRDIENYIAIAEPTIPRFSPFFWVFDRGQSEATGYGHVVQAALTLPIDANSAGLEFRSDGTCSAGAFGPNGNDLAQIAPQQLIINPCNSGAPTIANLRYAAGQGALIQGVDSAGTVHAVLQLGTGYWVMSTDGVTDYSCSGTTCNDGTTTGTLNLESPTIAAPNATSFTIGTPALPAATVKTGALSLTYTSGCGTGTTTATGTYTIVGGVVSLTITAGGLCTTGTAATTIIYGGLPAAATPTGTRGTMGCVNTTGIPLCTLVETLTDNTVRIIGATGVTFTGFTLTTITYTL
jgi:hypothetical protein